MNLPVFAIELLIEIKEQPYTEAEKKQSDDRNGLGDLLAEIGLGKVRGNDTGGDNNNQQSQEVHFDLFI